MPVHAHAQSEAGFTLVELLVSMVVLMIVMLATLQILDSSTTLAHRDTSRAHAIREAQVGMDRMIREVRHTSSVDATSTAQVLVVDVVQRGIARRVRFDCSVAHPDGGGLRRCTRTVGIGTPEILIDRVRSIGTDATVFTRTPATGTTRHVMVRLGLALDAGRTQGARRNLVLTDGTSLRNVP